MRVLVIADPHLTVPPLKYGGTERIVALVCDGLEKKVVEVDLLAKEGSKNYGGKNFFHKAPSKKRLSRVYRKIVFQGILVFLILARRYDCIINNGRVDYLWFVQLFTKIRLLNVFHNPIATYEIDILKKRVDNTIAIGISKKHVSPASSLNHRVIYNAIDVSAFKYETQATSRDYLLFLGRLTYNKGVDTAIAVAQATGLPLVIAGNISKEPGGAAFFETEVRPRLSSAITYVGEVDDVQKQQLLSGAIATLFPIRWEEPFGIVMIESLACGTPVIATRMGSVPEVIRHGETGFVCDTVEEMIAAVKNINQIDRRACRADVEKRFSQEAMVGEYLKLIQ